MRKIMSEFLDIGEKSYYVWKNTSHVKLMAFLEKYMDKDDMREFMDTEEIKKFKLIKEFSEKQNQYNEKILNMLEIFNDYDKRDYNSYDYHIYDFDATSYIYLFIEYLEPIDDMHEINLDTYNKFLMSKHGQALLKIHKTESLFNSYVQAYEKEYNTSDIDKAISGDTIISDCFRELKAANDEIKVIESVLNTIHKMITEANRNILLQLEILKKCDFEPLLKQATKGEFDDFLRSFLTTWIYKKYGTDRIRTINIMENITNLKKINLQEVIEVILKIPSEPEVKNSSIKASYIHQAWDQECPPLDADDEHPF